MVSSGRVGFAILVIVRLFYSKTRREIWRNVLAFVRARTLCNSYVLLLCNVAHLPPASSPMMLSSRRRTTKRTLLLQRQAAHSISILASLSS